MLPSLSMRNVSGNTSHLLFISRQRLWHNLGVEENRGFWVVGYDRKMYYARETQNLVPSDASRAMLATTMEERCGVLKVMGVKFYHSANEYSGLACINAWETKVGGERDLLERA